MSRLGRRLGWVKRREKLLTRRSSIKPPPRVPGCVWIPLTQGKFALIDKADAPLILKFVWCASRSGSNWYARTKGGRVSMHRLLASPRRKMCVDHKNGDGLDNRRSNLRTCHRQQNGWNRRATKGYKGVTWRKPWSARIVYNNKVLRLGDFETKEEAARAYDRAARRCFGEFARLNFPGEVR